MKPYQQVPIVECGEPLVAIPRDRFAIEQPHPYEKLAAPYGSKSPYFLRKGVLEQLLKAQSTLAERCPGWKILIFDAYRPIAVQQFMVDYTFRELVRSTGESIDLTPAQQQALLEQVYQFWAVPSQDPRTPPPHSTGAAIDVTLVDAAGQVLDMGSPIDELSARSHPDYFANGHDNLSSQFHDRRQLLRQIMASVGFCQHPNEWWHFSWGDQMWAWSTNGVARYGAI